MRVRITPIIVGALITVAAGILIFDVPIPPPPKASVENALDHVDFSTLPKKSSFAARDGTRLFYRAYPGSTSNSVVLIHGSSATTAEMHVLAQALQARGLSVYALAMRGHDGSGRSGDIDYIGQLDDDVADFLKSLPPKTGSRTLLGFSSGGGFALRFAGGQYGKLFDKYLLISPALTHDAPSARPYTGVGWTDAAAPRIVVLTILSDIGLPLFQKLPVLAFAVPPSMRNIQTTFYSYRLFRNFGATGNYLGDLKNAPAPVSLLVGSKDEFFYPDKFAPLLKPARPDLAVTILPGLNHMDMLLQPAAIKAIGDTILGNAKT